MKLTVASVLALLASSAIAAPSRIKRRACSSPVNLNGRENPFLNRKLHANSFYREEVEAAAAQISDPTLKAKALKVADIGTFLWMYVYYGNCPKGLKFFTNDSK